VTVVDTSAVMAVLLQEADAEAYARAMQDLAPLVLSAGTLVELGVVALRRGGEALANDLHALIEEADVEVVPVSGSDARMAIDAYARYGKGVGRPLCLNYGDCFAYALARNRDEPLLFKGDDFARTDLTPAL
jgi:ribonuclease VapC